MAHLLRPQGRRGEVLAEPLTDLHELVAPGRRVWLVPSGAAAPQPGAQARTLQARWAPAGRNAGRLVLKLEGCDSITEAEALAGHDLLLPRSELPPQEADTFLVADLLGCSLWDGSRPVGRITDVQFAVKADGRTRLPDAAPLLAVTPENLAATPADVPADPILVPFVRAWLESVDLGGRRLVMHLPPGLVD